MGTEGENASALAAAGGWRLYAELPTKPEGWHPPALQRLPLAPSALTVGGQGAPRPAPVESGVLSFPAQCSVTVVPGSGSGVSVARASRAGIKVGYLRTWSPAWGRAIVWTEFRQSSREDAVANDRAAGGGGGGGGGAAAAAAAATVVVVPPAAMAAAGLRPTPRGLHVLEAQWADHSSGNVFSDVPCYGSALGSGTNAALPASAGAAESAQAATAAATAPRAAVVEVMVHFQMLQRRDSEPAGPSSALDFKIVSLESC